MAHDCFLAIPEHYGQVELDYFVVMPNHVHGILVLFETPVGNGAGTMYRAPTNDNDNDNDNGNGAGMMYHAPTVGDGPLRAFAAPVAGSLGSVVGKYKAAVTRQARRLRRDPRLAVWQPNYWEHIIRNDRELDEVRRYIDENPIRWSLDRENPEAVEPEDDLPWDS
jgi:REP element-mobilizing transposase RayT